MIEFHNDHLVSPEICKLLYDTIPASMHIPVVLVPHTKKYLVRGTCNWTHIELNLQGIFYDGFNGSHGSIDFGIWKEFLFVAYHEFGHVATFGDCQLRQNAYDNDRREYERAEFAADRWANLKILELTDHDKRLCQPNSLGPYFDGRIIKIKNKSRKALHHNSWLKNYRCFKSGGQFSTGDVAWLCGTWRAEGNWGKPDNKLIRNIANDLAYKYKDRAGRLHMFFVWGDLLEIKRRVAIHKSKRPRKKASPSTSNDVDRKELIRHLRDPKNIVPNHRRQEGYLSD